MPTFDNLRKPKGHDFYIGSSGEEQYHVSRTQWGWRASPPLLNAKPGHEGCILASTLQGISEKLRDRARNLLT